MRFLFSQEIRTLLFVLLGYPYCIQFSIPLLPLHIGSSQFGATTPVSTFYDSIYLSVEQMNEEFYCGKKLQFGVVASRGKQFIPRGNLKLENRKRLNCSTLFVGT